MSFYDILQKYKNYDFELLFREIKDVDIQNAIQSEYLSEKDLIALLSPQASAYLEDMARKAMDLTIRNFGKVVHLYAPLYVSNFCENECLYCGFKHSNPIKRRKLDLPEVKKEAEILASTGIKHVLLLTGESREISSPSYIKDCIGILKDSFSSVSMEIYPLLTEEYGELVKEGLDGLVVYQETYDEQLYSKLHRNGPKKDFRFRLETPERVCSNNIRSVSIGALLGLSEPAKECFLMLMHAAYLQDTFRDVEVSVSFPRIQPQVGGFKPLYIVTDADLVRLILAARLFMPRIGINMSTREKNDLRMNLIGLGVTRVSAGSSTEVGGYSAVNPTDGQFNIADTTSVEKMKECIRAKGFQPVMKDWDHY